MREFEMPLRHTRRMVGESSYRYQTEVRAWVNLGSCWPQLFLQTVGLLPPCRWVIRSKKRRGPGLSLGKFQHGRRKQRTQVGETEKEQLNDSGENQEGWCHESQEKIVFRKIA